MQTNHIAILGMSFTGSTIISHALGALPGCANIDEAHWLVDNVGEYCCQCGSKCKKWTLQVREQLRSSQRFYDDVRIALDADTLISADKDPRIYLRLQPSGDRRYLMLYRDPMEQRHSALRAAEAEGSTTDQTKFLNWWVDKNIEILGYLSAHGGSFLLNLGDFQRDPKVSIQKICRAFGLRYGSDWERYWEKETHAIGGNFNPFTLIGEGRIDEIRIKPREKADALPNLHEDSAALFSFLNGHRKNLRRL